MTKKEYTRYKNASKILDDARRIEVKLDIISEVLNRWNESGVRAVTC